MMRKSLSQRVAESMRCKILLMLSLISILFTSCSPQKRLAYDFVNKTKGASVAFYVPKELKKTNIRRDCDPSNIDLVTLDEDQLRDTIAARTRIVNKINDDIFLNVLYASFESTLKDYDLAIEYYDEEIQPDSLHWIIDLSHIEIQEYVETLLSHCGVDGNF